MAPTPTPRGSTALAARALRWYGAIGLGASVVAGVAGGWMAGVGVAVVLVAGVLPMRAGWLADVDALDRTIVALGRVRQDGLPPQDLQGPAGRVVHEVQRILADAEAAERRGQEAVERTGQMLEAAPNGIVVLGLDGRVEYANEALKRLLALSKDPQGMLPVEVLRAPALLEALDHVRTTGTAAEPRDLSRGELDLEVTAHPMDRGVLALVRDVSRERRVTRARTDFVANVSHELRTPIAAILGFAETVIATPGLDPQLSRMVGKIHRNGIRLRQLFEDLMTLYKLEARRRELPKEEVRLGVVLPSAVVPAVDAAAQKDVAFDVDVDESLVVWGNRQALSTILGNLASNAVKYTPAGGRVSVATRMEDGRVHVDVRDSGVGIPKAALPRVFERFYRVDEGRARDVGGTGLGLAIVKHLAEASGCIVSVDSEEGQGSTFTVKLPAPPAERPDRTWASTLDGGGSSERSTDPGAAR